MDLKKTVSSVWHELVVHWISLGLTALGAAAVSYWGLISANWSWPSAVAVGIVVAAAGICAYAALRHLSRASTSPKHSTEWSPFPPSWNDPPREIFRQHYENETVELDGKQFTECSFVNVKFNYEGTGRVGMFDCRYGTPGQETPVTIVSKNPVVLNVFLLLRALKMIKGGGDYGIHKAGTR